MKKPNKKSWSRAGQGTGNRNTWIKPRPISDDYKKLLPKDRARIKILYCIALRDGSLLSLNKDVVALMREVNAIERRTHFSKNRLAYNKKLRDYRQNSPRWKKWQKGHHIERMRKRRVFRAKWARKNPISASIKKLRLGGSKRFKETIYNEDGFEFTNLHPDADKRVLQKYTHSLRELSRTLSRTPSPIELADFMDWPRRSLCLLTLKLTEQKHHTKEKVRFDMFFAFKILNVPDHSIVQDIGLWKRAARNAFCKTDPRLKRVLKCRLPRLAGTKVVRITTLRDLGKEFGVTYQRIQQLEWVALEKLRWAANELGGYRPRLPDTFGPQKTGPKGPWKNK